MYEDKTLVCKECGQEFVFTAGEQEFYAERGFQNEPSAASPAATPAKTPPVVPGSISPLSAPPAAARPACPLSPALTVRSIAASALPRCARSSANRFSGFRLLCHAIENVPTQKRGDVFSGPESQRLVSKTKSINLYPLSFRNR